MASQKQRILRVLERNPERGMCSTSPVRWDPPILRTAARIADLKADGYEIRSEPCDSGDHGNATAVRYILEGRPASTPTIDPVTGSFQFGDA